MGYLMANKLENFNTYHDEAFLVFDRMDPII